MTDESTSKERQREQIETWARLHGHEVVAVSEDTDVSGKVSPFKRRQLGPWLTDPALIGQWDVLVTAKLDRATRSVVDLGALVEFCETRGKSYASVAESIDLTGAAGRMVANVIIAMAQFERERIGERRKESARYLRQSGRWDGGMVPYGYRAAKDGNGWTLELDPKTAPVAQRIAAMLIEGASLSGVARALNAGGIPAAKYGKMWRPQTVALIASSRTLTGWYGDRPCFPAVVPADDWRQLQTALKANSKPHAIKHSRGSMLLGVAYCPCGAKLYRLPTAKVYYRCAARCSPGIPAEELESIAVEALIETYGYLPYGRRVVVTADHSDELAAVEDAIRGLDLDAPDYDERHAELRAERVRIKELPSGETRERWEPVLPRQTVMQRWDSLPGPTERGELLRTLGARMIASKPKGGSLIVSIVGGELFETMSKLSGISVKELVGA